jgi:hypothetical protein
VAALWLSAGCDDDRSYESNDSAPDNGQAQQSAQTNQPPPNNAQAAGQPNTPAQNTDTAQAAFVGAWSGPDDEGNTYDLTFRQEGDRLTGTAQTEGTRFSLEGRVNAGAAAGKVTRVDSQDVFDFRAVIGGDGVMAFTISGGGEQETVRFNRVQ